ncbi:unnamed protein product [Mycena citricolor]|uniref:Uncharacterized protein n=1 Tax=Mycena citricolor TaxID=2018698 RepID=A0AAD2HMW8_9AGAR|nr:unnamed protein product [Mycena citricolor]
MLLPHVNNTVSLARTGEALDNANGPLSRTLFAIIWGCLSTIFASVWVSVHPNVPAPSTKVFWTATRRVRFMLVALAAPEAVVAFALRQFIYARKLYQAHRTPPDSLSMTHAFFLSMGGFIDADGKVIATEGQLNKPGVLAAVAAVKQAEIQDKSKGDGFTKGVALLQGLWFLLQMIGRVVQRLPVTQLEVSTVGFAALTPVVWLLWWRKPLDVQEPIVLAVHLATPSSTARSDTPSKEDAQNDLAALPKTPATPASINTPLQEDANETETWHDRLWNRFGGLVLGNYDDPTGRSVPTFWSHSEAESDSEVTWRSFSVAQRSLLSQAVFGLIFGGFHCAAWNVDFPSVIEKWLWRSCAILVTFAPTIFMGSLNTISIPKESDGLAYDLLVFLPLALVIFALPILYVLARLALLVLMFTSLRDIPIGAFSSVDWTGFIPHFL